jgi:hypothetical protein
MRLHFFSCGCFARNGQFKECIRKRLLKRCSTTKNKHAFVDERCSDPQCPKKLKEQLVKDRKEEAEAKRRQAKNWGESTQEALDEITRLPDRRHE